MAGSARPRPGSIRAGAAKTPSRASYCFPVAAVEDAAVLRARGDGKTNDAWLSQTVADPGPDRTGPLGGAPDVRGQGGCQHAPQGQAHCGVGLFFQMRKNYAPEALHPDDNVFGKAYVPSHQRASAFWTFSWPLSGSVHFCFCAYNSICCECRRSVLFLKIPTC